MEKITNLESDLRSLIDARSESVWSIDAEYNYVITNKYFKNAYKKVYGIKLESGQNALKILSPKLRRFWKEKYDTALNGKAFSFEFTEAVEGKEHIFDVTLSPITEGGKIIGVSAYSVDITERKELEKKFFEIEERFRKAFETSPDSININRLDDGLYVDINDGFTNITGYTKEETVGRTSKEINIWHDPEDRERLVEGLKKEGEVRNLEAKFRMKDDSVGHGLMSAKIINLNNVPHILSITRNIDDLKKIEKEREELLNRTEESRRLLDEVFSRINDGVVALDKEWIYTYVNQKAAILLNKEKPEELIGKHIWTEYPEGVGQPFYKAYLEAMKKQKVIHLEEFYKPWNRYFENRIYPSPNGITIYFTDVTDRKLAEMSLARNEKRFSNLFEYSPVSLWEEDTSALIKFLKKKRIKNLRSYIKKKGDFVFELAKKLNVINVNKESLKMFEAGTKEELISNISKTFTDNSFNVFVEEIESILKGETEFRSEVEFKTLKGKIFNALIHVKTELYPDNMPVDKYGNTIVSITDISEKKRAEQELLQKKNEMESAYRIGRKLNLLNERKDVVRESLKEIVKISGSNVSFLLMKENNALQTEDIFFSDDKLSFKRFPEHIVGECICGKAAADKRAIYSKNIFEDKKCTWNECKDIGLKSIAAIPLFRDRELLGVLGFGSFDEVDYAKQRDFFEMIATDISNYLCKIILKGQIKEYSDSLEMTVEKRTEELSSANRDLESFSFSISHDLRAPLRAIAGFSKILYEDHYKLLPDNGRELIDDILANTRKMGDLIDDLLNFSRIGRKSIRMSDISMRSLFSISFKELKALNRNRNIKLELGDIPDAKGDYSLIRQVILNLLSNAIKFSSRRSESVINISGKETEDMTEYSVSDNGVGFEMKYYDKLFNVFQRLHGQDEFEGTGVGLAIVKRIIDLHGGDVKAESVIGKGSIFYFSLPK